MAAVTPAELARLAPTGLARLASPGYVRAPFVALVERHLLDVSAGRTRRLRVALPPRAGKSELISRFFLAWYLLTHPDKRAILACATAALAETYSRKVRDLVHEFGPLFGARLRPDSRAVDRWDTTAGGGLIAVGAGSSVVGRGAQLLVADDVIAGNEVATSKAQLEKLVQWFRSDLLTRLEPGGACVVVGTRWAELDIHGTLEAEERAGGDAWAKVILPALCEEPNLDPLGRREGEPLFPERYTAEELARIRSAIGSHAFAGLYQQRPVPRDGGLFKPAWARRYLLERSQGTDARGEPLVFVVFPATGQRVSLGSAERFITVDTATSESARSDFTAIACWVAMGEKLLLLDLDMRRLDGPKIADAIKAMCSRYHALAWIEDTTGSKHLLAYLQAEGVVFRTVKPDRSKLARAIPASALMEQGRLVFPQEAHFLAAAEHQLFSFTGGVGGGAHDDFVDCLSMAVQIFTEEINAGGAMPMAPLPPSRPKQYLPPGVEVPAPPGFAKSRAFGPFGQGTVFPDLGGRGDTPRQTGWGSRVDEMRERFGQW